MILERHRLRILIRNECWCLLMNFGETPKIAPLKAKFLNTNSIIFVWNVVVEASDQSLWIFWLRKGQGFCHRPPKAEFWPDMVESLCRRRRRFNAEYRRWKRKNRLPRAAFDAEYRRWKKLVAKGSVWCWVPTLEEHSAAEDGFLMLITDVGKIIGRW